MTRGDIIHGIKSCGYVLMEGSRNDDAVNLAIVVYDDAEGNVETADQLYELVTVLIDYENMEVSKASDFEYLKDKCEVLMEYLPQWYATGDIYGYAI